MKINTGSQFLQASKEIQNINEIMDQSNAISENLDRNSDVLFRPISEADPGATAIKGTVIQDTAKLRIPQTLNTRITMELSEGDLNAKAWDAAGPAERITMTNRMFDIMLKEMQIPGQIRSKLRLWYFGSSAPTAGMRGFSNRYNPILEKNELGSLDLKDNPRVNMHYSLLYQDFDTALGALYNQAIYIMQQTTCLEPAGTYPDPVEQAKWAAEMQDKTSHAPAVHNDMYLFAASAEKEMLAQYHRIIKNKGIYNTHNISFK